MPLQAALPRTFTKLIVVCASFISVSLMAVQPAWSKGDITGIWIDDTGKGAILIQHCGNENRSVCGYIIWTSRKSTRPGKPLTDAYNPNPRLRNQPICGLQIIGRLAPQRDGSWDNGWIYDPKQGASYDVEVRRVARDALRVTGYLGLKFLGKSFIWKRATDEVERCN